MKLALISDTHGFLPALPTDVDAIIHAGDIGPDRDPINWFRDRFYPYVEALGVPYIATFGNHDRIGERQALPDNRPMNLRFLVDEPYELEGVKFWFSPWSNLFGNWAFMRTEEGLAHRYALIPEDTQIIVSHGPPKCYGDRIFWDGEYRNVGSEALETRARELPNLRLLVTGHIHEAFGEYHLGAVKVLNVSHVNEMYQPTNEAVVVELDADDY
jgi:Icc-related predicted phosphoesterase